MRKDPRSNAALAGAVHSAPDWTRARPLTLCFPSRGSVPAIRGGAEISPVHRADEVLVPDRSASRRNITGLGHPAPWSNAVPYVVPREEVPSE